MATHPKYAATAWTTAANSYGDRIAPVTFTAAEQLISMSSSLSPLKPDSVILELGAGTGSLTKALSAAVPSASILATDVSPGMLELLSAALPNVSTRLLDATKVATELKGQTFSHVLGAFMMQFCVDPDRVFRNCRDALVPGGVCGHVIWGLRSDIIDTYRQACRAIDPSWKGPNIFPDYAWMTADQLGNALRRAGFEEVQTQEIDLRFPFDSAEDLEEFIYGTKNPAVMEQVEAWKGDPEPVKRELKKIARDKYDDAKEIYNGVVFGVGVKKT